MASYFPVLVTQACLLAAPSRLYPIWRARTGPPGHRKHPGDHPLTVWLVIIFLFLVFRWIFEQSKKDHQKKKWAPIYRFPVGKKRHPVRATRWQFTFICVRNGRRALGTMAFFGHLRKQERRRPSTVDCASCTVTISNRSTNGRPNTGCRACTPRLCRTRFSSRGYNSNRVWCPSGGDLRANRCCHRRRRHRRRTGPENCLSACNCRGHSNLRKHDESSNRFNAGKMCVRA